ncbi:MAG: XdhC family protein, partial [Aeromonas veronii]
AMAQIIESRGSTPRHQAQMLVMADGQILGTIGGGMIERLVIEEAMAAIAERKPRIFHGRMARNGEHAVGSDCGGAMSVYIDVYGLRPRLVLIGAGHVNRALAHAAAPLGFDIHVGDCFEGSLNPDHFPTGTHLKQADTISAVIEALAIEPANFVIIATNHQDKEALERLINRPLAYLGLLASKRKVQTFTQALRQQGVSQEQLQRLHAPIGYNIGAETPEEIAISILAELLQVKNGKSGGLMQDDVRLKRDQLVVMRGSGDIATGVALRLHNAGFKVVMLDLDKPTVIRRTVAFAQGMFDGETSVEGVSAKRVESVEQAFEQLDRGIIPLLVDPD